MQLPVVVEFEYREIVFQSHVEPVQHIMLPEQHVRIQHHDFRRLPPEEVPQIANHIRHRLCIAGAYIGRNALLLPDYRRANAKTGDTVPYEQYIQGIDGLRQVALR